MQICQFICLRLMAREESQDFLEPVPNTVPNYYYIIREPMDFSKIRKRLFLTESNSQGRWIGRTVTVVVGQVETFDMHVLNCWGNVSIWIHTWPLLQVPTTLSRISCTKLLWYSQIAPNSTNPRQKWARRARSWKSSSTASFKGCCRTIGFTPSSATPNPRPQLQTRKVGAKSRERKDDTFNHPALG